MGVYSLGDHTPRIHESAWIAKSAKVIGRVEMAEGSSVWFGAVVRGDVEDIRIGRNTNIQDNSVLHADTGIPLTIGDNVTVGHLVMLHGCTIGDGALIGIRAVVLNGAKIGRNCVVGAGSVVTEDKIFPDGTLILGTPAKVVRELSPEQIAEMQHGAKHYLTNAQRFRAQLKRIDRSPGA
jgi:carbonic anhydrase/acetyltransferase-like protein (isoleucine patch superfamily)